MLYKADKSKSQEVSSHRAKNFSIYLIFYLYKIMDVHQPYWDNYFMIMLSQTLLLEYLLIQDRLLGAFLVPQW